MSMRKPRPLALGYTSELDTVTEQTWSELLQEFDDANIYQAGAYAAVISGKRNLSHLILRHSGDVVAIAQARIAKIPIIKLGIAYIQWGPLWRRSGADADPEVFRQAIRALRNEFVCKRGLTLRLFPRVWSDDSSYFSALLEEEAFSSLGQQTRGRTILMDLSTGPEALRESMRSHWKRELKVAEKNKLEVVEGTSDDMFDAFIRIYKEMVSRKKFAEPNDITQFRLIQAKLPEQLKMRILLCKSGADVSSGVICSALGNTAVYLFGATSNGGMKSRGSYLLQWKLIERLKSDGLSVYDLNGINPAKNPGTYKFKDDLAGKNGKDVYFLGRFDSQGSFLSNFCVRAGDVLRSKHRSVKELAKTARAGKVRARLAGEERGAV